MKALLIQNKLQQAIKDPNTLSIQVIDVQKTEIHQNAYSITILYLANNVLQHIDGEETIYGVQNKLGERFLTNSLASSIFLKEKVFGLRMHRNKNLQQNLDEFKKVSITLASMDDEKIEDKSQAIILLSLLHESYRKVKVAIKFQRKTITLDESCCPLDHGKWI